MLAEHALRAQIAPNEGVVVSSSGTGAQPMDMYEGVRARLIERGIDPTGHVQRKLTQQILDDADLSVAMGFDHQAFTHKQFGQEIPLFNRVCFGRDEPVIDLGEKLTNWREDPKAADVYVIQMVDTIWEAIPSFKAHVDVYWQ
jgi:protein-tyrosine-phosphatase